MAECSADNRKDFADKLYGKVKDLPILDYHCHLDPKEIFEDKQFTSIGDLWLSGDHYKWRLMRTAGVDEKYITGDAPIKEKYYKFVEVLSTAFHNPIKEWAQDELKKYFDVTLKIEPKNADKIWDLCDKKIQAEKLSPRKLLALSNVRYVCTTDDITSDLYFHTQLKDCGVKIIPSFRTDNLFIIGDRVKYLDYLEKLGDTENITIDSLTSLKDVVNRRLMHFIANGCKFSDIGIEGFPSRIADDDEASITFKKILSGEVVTAADADGLFGNLYLFLGTIYKQHNVVQQWHVSVLRNANTRAFENIGRDSGFDCVGDIVPVKNIRNMLDAIEQNGGLPETVIYTLNPAMNYPLATLVGSFRGVHLGIAWWFNDHKRGMKETFSVLSEVGHIESLLGMLTDSRSFLSYIRHDYYRRLLCGFLAKYADGDFDGALSVAEKLCYKNVADLVGE